MKKSSLCMRGKQTEKKRKAENEEELDKTHKNIK